MTVENTKGVAFVTGGAGGIGAAICRKLGAEGYSLAIGYCRSEEKAGLLEKELAEQGICARPVRVDVSSSGSVGRAVEEICRLLGPVTLLVNNAGISEYALCQDISDDAWNRMIGTNLSGAFFCCREVLPGMIREQRGCIINVSSIWGLSGASMEVHYSAAKAGLIGLTRALAKEVAPSGIRVNCVAPGAIDTEMMARFTSAELDAFLEEIPAGRLGRPEEIAETVAFLAKEGTYLNGQVISPNGGMM